MIIGEYPCCGGEMMLPIPEGAELPKFQREKCPHCTKTVWHYLSRVSPMSYTADAFHKKYKVNNKTRNVDLRIK